MVESPEMKVVDAEYRRESDKIIYRAEGGDEAFEGIITPDVLPTMRLDESAMEQLAEMLPGTKVAGYPAFNT